MRFTSFKRHIAVACFTLFGASAASAAPINSVYFFGDSLSDTGNAANLSGSTLPPGYATGQAVNGNSAGLWVNTFAASLGLASNSTFSRAGGNNYAYGGGRMGTNTGAGVPYLNQQVSQYLSDSSGAANANGLYVILMGGNDIAAIIGDATAPGANPNQAISAGITTGIGSLAGQVQALYAAGARNFLLFNAPDVLPTPRFQGVLNSLVNADGTPNLAARGGLNFVANATVTNWNAAFNQAVLNLRAGLAGEDIDTVDLYGYGTSTAANLVGAGYDGSTTACYNNGVICANPSTRFFWDSFHPNSRAHLQIAQLALNAIPVPGALALMLVGLLGFAAAARRRS